MIAIESKPHLLCLVIRVIMLERHKREREAKRRKKGKVKKQKKKKKEFEFSLNYKTLKFHDLIAAAVAACLPATFKKERNRAFWQKTSA